jgi:hypothetical protein
MWLDAATWPPHRNQNGDHEPRVRGRHEAAPPRCARSRRACLAINASSPGTGAIRGQLLASAMDRRSHRTRSGSRVYHFRRDFDLAARPDRFLVRISADNRYRLFVNEVEVSNGPARSDLMHWRYETVDIAGQLHHGHNVVAALVWNFGQNRPAAQLSLRTAFLLQGESEAESAVDTGPSWKVLRDTGYSFSPVIGEHSSGYYVAGPNESLDANAYPWGWERADTDSSQWPAAERIAEATMRGVGYAGLAKDWQLTPRNIPAVEQDPVRFAAVRRASGIKANDAFLQGVGDFLIPANSHVSILVDQRYLTMGYPVLRTTSSCPSQYQANSAGMNVRSRSVQALTWCAVKRYAATADERKQ